METLLDESIRFNAFFQSIDLVRISDWIFDFFDTFFEIERRIERETDRHTERKTDLKLLSFDNASKDLFISDHDHDTVCHTDTGTDTDDNDDDNEKWSIVLDFQWFVK